MVADMTITELTERLLKVLREEIDYYHQIMDITRKQRKCIDDTDIKSLLGFVKEKEDIITKIKKVEEEMIPYRDEWQKRKDEMSEYSRSQCEKYVGELNGILENLMQLEGENEEILSQRVKKLEGELQNIQKGKQARNTYFPKGGPENPQFIDRKK